MTRYIIDSYAIIAFFEDEPGANRVASILNDMINRKSKGYMSVINWGEIYYNTFRVQGEAAALSAITQLARYPIEIVEANQELTYQAVKLKARFKIAYADCFAAALAGRLKAPVLTGDQEFRKLKAEISIEWVL